jgi:hypothetical protein
MQAHDFVCEDCGSHVYSWGGDPGATLCHGCELIRTMTLQPDDETKLRHWLGCEREEAKDGNTSL